MDEVSRLRPLILPGASKAPVVEAREEWFGAWKDAKQGKRGEDYEALKRRFQELTRAPEDFLTLGRGPAQIVAVWSGFGLGFLSEETWKKRGWQLIVWALLVVICVLGRRFCA